MAFTAAQFSTIRQYIGSEPTAAEIAAGSRFPTDLQVDAEAATIGTSDEHVIALHYVGQWCADMERGVTRFNLPGEYSESKELNLPAMQKTRATLQAIVSPGQALPGLPTLGDGASFGRSDRTRLWDDAATSSDYVSSE